MTRRRLTQREKADICARQEYICGCGCGLSLLNQDLEYDHRLPLELGGADHERNIDALIASHHRHKTNVIHPAAPLLGSDKAMIAKAKRIEKKRTGERKRRGPKIQNRGFRKDVRRKMDGSVVPR